MTIKELKIPFFLLRKKFSSIQSRKRYFTNMVYIFEANITAVVKRIKEKTEKSIKERGKFSHINFPT